MTDRDPPAAQGDLFGPTLVHVAPRHEVHEHCFVSGRRAAGTSYKFSHSHEGGDQPHRHSDTGPASYTIDRDAWFRATGATGGGKKEYTEQPTGEQFPLVALTEEETSFTVIGYDPPQVPPGFSGEGGGSFAVARMAMTFKQRPKFRVMPGGRGGESRRG